MKNRLDYKGKYANVAMPQGCLYLNNDGSRFVTRDMRFVLVLPNGKKQVRIADYYGSWGNWGTVGYRVKGKRYERIPKGADGLDTRTGKEKGIDALPHVFHEL